jgi:hypothetical protein
MKIPNRNNDWSPWTIRSINSPFKSTEKAVGDGEQKLGAEYNIQPQGQNISYDLEVFGEKWEVKKMDSDNSFRLGVEVASDYNKIIESVINVVEKTLKLEGLHGSSKSSNVIKSCIRRIKQNSGRTKTLLLEGLRKGEVSEASLDKANEVIEEVKKIVLIENKKILLYSSYDGSLAEYDLMSAYHKLSFESISINEKLKILDCNLDSYHKVAINSLIGNDISLFKNQSLKEALNGAVRGVFGDVQLVLVHEINGYKMISELDKIFCNRITSGGPRCKVLD